jgi:ubiquinone/menaquinone biosynthesis C-methylase UbiE
MSGAFEPFVDRLMRRYLGAGGMMLDVGCGPATYRRVCQGRYVGIDNTVRGFTADLAREPDAAASGDCLPFRAETFDLVMCKSTLYILADPRAALGEFHRVLKPGGRVLVVDYNRRTQRDLQRRLATKHPCWTQWQLLRRVRSSGFRDCRLLSTKDGEMGSAEQLLRPPLQELFGTWAIVLGIK